MSPRILGLVWAASLALSGGLGLFFVLLGGNGAASDALRSRIFGETPSHETIFLGSSLSGAAIPPGSPDTEAVPWGRTIRKWAPLISADELTEQIEQALDARPKRLFIEVRPLTRPTDPDRFHLRLNSISLAARTGAASLWAGAPSPGWMADEGQWLDGDFSEREEGADLGYREGLAGFDAGKLTALLARADAGGTRVFLIAFPRAQSSIDQGEEASPQDIRQAVESIGRDLKLPLFTPDIAWPDTLFHDRMHLNAAGRERYIAELEAWWRGQ